MDRPNFISFVIVGLLFTGICARPGQLKQQKYEFQEFHASSSQHQITSSSQSARYQAAPIQHEATPWSQQHPNEVNAFAEMFRQNYNQMVARHNEMMQMQKQSWANMFIPVTYELYHVPVGYTWHNYFGTQQQYVQDETERMSRQLIEDIQQGRRAQQELVNPNFFIEQAASELDRVHQSHELIEAGDTQNTENLENSYQQQQQSIFSESVHRTDSEQTGYAKVYNEKSKQYEYVQLRGSSVVPPHEELAGSMNSQHPSYLQSLPPIKFDNEKLNRFDQQIEQIEVHTPIFVETPRPVQQRVNEIAPKSTPNPSIYQPTQINNDEYYGSTYDQQPKFDLQFVESQSASTPSSRHIMSLVRNRTKVKVSTTTEEPTTTTTTTTTPLPTTTSGIMSMLPNKKPAMNYTDLYQQVRAELDKHLNQMADNKTEETHFMGMTSNSDHVKLTYETVNREKDGKESRGDQGITADDYNYDESTETEPGMGFYTVKTEPALIEQSTFSPSTAPPVHPNPFYSASLAPFPTVASTAKPANPYYSAPLAPFPEDMLKESDGTQQHLHFAEYSEITDMNQQVQTIEHHYGGHFEEAHTIQDVSDHDEFNQGQFQIPQAYIDMHQFEDEQQRYTDVGASLDIGQSIHHPMAQKYETQLPPEQAYRNPDLQHPSRKDAHQEKEVVAHVQEVIVTPAPVGAQIPKKNWFNRQFDKVKGLF